jgi:hypothetical protein
LTELHNFTDMNNKNYFFYVPSTPKYYFVAVKRTTIYYQILTYVMKIKYNCNWNLLLVLYISIELPISFLWDAVSASC